MWDTASVNLYKNMSGMNSTQMAQLLTDYAGNCAWREYMHGIGAGGGSKRSATCPYKTFGILHKSFV